MSHVSLRWNGHEARLCWAVCHVRTGQALQQNEDRSMVCAPQLPSK